MNEYICPFMSIPLGDLNGDGRITFIPCQKEKCMAWGVVNAALSDKEETIYGCRLIEQRRNLLK